MTELLLSVDGIEVWHGDSLDADTVATIMGARCADLLCVDAPYSARTHNSHRDGKLTADRAGSFVAPVNPTSNQRACAKYAAKVASGAKERSDLEYSSWSLAEVEQLCLTWSTHVSGWWVSITDHELFDAWEVTFKECLKLLTFAPLPWVETGSRVRMMGDGPSNWSCWVAVGRPRTRAFAKWGTLRGAYIMPAENHQNRPDRITGGKSLPGMMELLCDYSREGQLVVDPCLGGGTTALAAIKTGRRCIGIEKDRGRAELCVELVRAELGCTTRSAAQRGQAGLFGGAA